MCWDRIPAQGMSRDPQVFGTIHWDVAGPLEPSKKLRFNHFVIFVASYSRYPFAYPLRNLSAKSMCDALIRMLEITGVPVGMIAASNKASNFKASLTREVMKRLSISPVFSSPYHPVSTVERAIQTAKNTIAKLAYEHKDSWTNYLGAVLWAMRSTINQGIGVPPQLLVFGTMPRGPLAILKETWCGENDLPPDASKSTVEYLQDLRQKLEIAYAYSDECFVREKTR